jgi:hypothetical protein
MSSEDVVDKIVVELDYEISPHAEKEIQKYQEIGAKVQKTVSNSNQKKLDNWLRKVRAKNSFKKNGDVENVDGMVNKNKKSKSQRKTNAKTTGAAATSSPTPETYDVGGKTFKSFRGRIPETMRKLLDKLRKDQTRSAEEKMAEDLFEKASSKDIKKARARLEREGYDAFSMGDKDAFKTDFMNSRQKVEEKAQKAREKQEKIQRKAEEAQRKEQERAAKARERAEKAAAKIQEKIEKASARERNKKTLAEEKNRTSLLRKTFRTLGIATTGYIGVNIARKVMQKMGDLFQYSSNVRTGALLGNVTPEKMQAVEDWFKAKNISPDAGMKTLQSYSNFMKLNDLPLDKVLQKFIGAVQNRSPQALRAAVAHGADANTLRVLRDYRGNVGKELGEIQKEVYTDDDLKKFDRVGNAISKFQNMIHRSKILVQAADKLGDFIEFVTDALEKIINFFNNSPMEKLEKLVNQTKEKLFQKLGWESKAPQLKEIRDEENEKIHLSRVAPKLPISQLKDDSSQFQTSMDERLKAVNDYLANDDNPTTDRRFSAATPSNIVVNNSFNIQSIDPEKGAQEAQTKFSKKFFEVIDTYHVQPATVK